MWRYVFILSHDLTSPPHQRVMRNYGWKLIGICHHPGKSCDHEHCDSRDMFLNCHVTTRKHMFKELYEYIGESSSW